MLNTRRLLLLRHYLPKHLRLLGFARPPHRLLPYELLNDLLGFVLLAFGVSLYGNLPFHRE